VNKCKCMRARARSLERSDRDARGTRTAPRPFDRARSPAAVAMPRATKAGAILVKLLSTAETGFFYVKVRALASVATDASSARDEMTRRRRVAPSRVRRSPLPRALRVLVPSPRVTHRDVVDSPAAFLPAARPPVAEEEP